MEWKIWFIILNRPIIGQYRDMESRVLFLEDIIRVSLENIEQVFERVSNALKPNPTSTTTAKPQVKWTTATLSPTTVQ